MSNSKQSIKRSLSRLVAVQSLYQYDFYCSDKGSDKDVLAISKQLLENYFLSEEQENPTSYLDKIDADLLESLLSGIILALANIDEEIKSFLKDQWRAEDMPDLMMPILRLASFELKFMKDTPTKVIISEYVDLAACYYEEKKVNFINKLLQNIADKNR